VDNIDLRLCEKVIELKYWRFFDDQALELKLQLVSGPERVYVRDPCGANAGVILALRPADFPAGSPPDFSVQGSCGRVFRQAGFYPSGIVGKLYRFGGSRGCLVKVAIHRLRLMQS
jgi:hypothetical protein